MITSSETDEASQLEPWVDWIRRVTHRAEEQAAKMKIESWTVRSRRQRWRWADRVVNKLPKDRWAVRSLEWDPQAGFDGRASKAHRRQGRPNIRWTDQFTSFAEIVYQKPVCWSELVKNKNFWSQHQESFAHHIVNSTD